MKAFLDAPREQVQVAHKPFVVQPYNTGKYKFRVVGTGEFSNAKKPFVSDKQAVAFAAERNRAVKLRANAPMPRHARGADPEGPFCRVAPLNSDTYRPDLRYRAHVYFEGEKTAKEWKFRTEKRSLEFANRKNLEFERERAQVVGARPRPARAPRRELAAMPTPEDVEKPKPGVTPRVQWTKDQIDGIDSGHHYNPMKGPPFRIHSTTQAGYSFVVCGPTLADKNRELRCFKTEREAKTYAHMRNTEAQTQGFDSLSFPAWLRVTAQRCHGQLSERGKSLEDATRYYLEDLDRTEKSISLRDIVKRCLAAKKEAGFTKGYLYSLRRGLHLFRHTLGEKRIISEITPLDMVAYLTAIPGTPSTRNSLRQMLSSLFSFADKLGFCSSNPMRGAEKEKVVDAPGGVLTPTQLAAHPRCRAARMGAVPRHWCLCWIAHPRAGEARLGTSGYGGRLHRSDRQKLEKRTAAAGENSARARCLSPAIRPIAWPRLSVRGVHSHDECSRRDEACGNRKVAAQRAAPIIRKLSHCTLPRRRGDRAGNGAHGNRAHLPALSAGREAVRRRSLVVAPAIRGKRRGQGCEHDDSTKPGKRSGVRLPVNRIARLGAREGRAASNRPQVFLRGPSL